MALLTLAQRRAFFKDLGLGAYNKDNILKLQKKYLYRQSDYDGIYGQNTDNLLRHLKNVKDHCKNFAPEEFRCGCNGRYCSGYPNFMKASELANIQSIRTHFSKPMIVTCGLRCVGYNREVGGISNSEHLYGLATDYYIQGVTDTLDNRKQSIKWISTLPNHNYTYGNGIYAYTEDGKTSTGYKSAPGMGNAMHTDSKFAVVPTDGNTATQKPKPNEPTVIKPVVDTTATKYKVIDVSNWQGSIDWKKVKADGVVGAIIRYADGSDIDSRFHENMKGAKAVDLHIGAYTYSRAKTWNQGEKEAEALFNACKPYSCDMPLYIDLEADGLESTANTVAQAFITKMKSLGGFAGVYANLTWWNNYLTKVTPPARWVAQHYSKCQYKGSYGMWQYSDEGSVKGINGNVDMDWLYVDYWNKIKPSEKGTYPGTYPSYRLVKTNAQVIADCIAWLKYITGNNNFHYGYGRHSHHNGCYFCGTQPTSKKNSGIKMWQTTYCCNPFVHAGWAHGGCIPRALKMCQGYGSWDMGTGSGSYHTCDLFTHMGDLPTSKLKVGDVLCSDTHVAIYAGNGKVLQAGHEDDNVKNSKSWNSSISLSTWNGYSRVYRFNSSVNADLSIFYGEMSDRVALLWDYMNWYFDGALGQSQRYYGDKIMGYTKRFQREQGLVDDGIAGPKTIEAMKKVKK